MKPKMSDLRYVNLLAGLRLWGKAKRGIENRFDSILLILGVLIVFGTLNHISAGRILAIFGSISDWLF